MATIFQAKALLSLPSNPKIKPFIPQTLRQRTLTLNSIKPKTLNSLSLSQSGLKKFHFLGINSYDFGVKNKKIHICKAEAEAFGSAEVEQKKILGIEVTTLKELSHRDTKDVLVVTAKGSSAEIIPFLKTWVNLPMAIGFMLLYTKLANVLSKKALFYSTILPFIAFFGAFGFVLYPLSNYFHPTAFADKLLDVLGPRFLGPIAIEDLSVMLDVVDCSDSVEVDVDITTVDEAKKFYPLFGLGANVALIFSGRTVDGWAISLKAMMSIVVLMGFVICLCYWWANHYVPLPTRSKKKKLRVLETTTLLEDKSYDPDCGEGIINEKPNMGTMESIKFLASSKYIRNLATVVVAYGISINLVEVTWKSKLKAQFPSPNEYSSFMGDFSSATGVATFTMMLLSQWIFNKYGWGVAASITPTVLLLTGVGFFSLILFGGPIAPLLAQFGMTPLLAAVYVGAMQNIFSKSAKYSLFDPCKEMAYIPLDEDTKVKGKAAIDVVCNPLGKSGGALIQQFMILTFGSLANSTPYLGGILLVIVLAWLAAARSLDKQFTALRQEEELEEEMERAAVKIPVVSQESDSNGPVVGGPALNTTGGDSSSSSSEPSSPRKM
ncbi:hypothetical protein Leryth_023719 [Lithospermum erythrorhizon]|nr:hypothetical protein Leryth_023719 [Lithospermum erythrorhizon]